MSTQIHADPVPASGPAATEFVARLPLPHAPESMNRMTGLIFGYQASQIVGTLARLRIPDQLAERDLTAAELGRRIGCDESALTRLLRGAAAIGLILVRPEGRFALTALGGLLRSDVPGSLRGAAAANTGPSHYLPWGKLEDVIRTGRCQAQAALGSDFFGHLAQHPDELADFSTTMEFLSEMVTAPFAKSVDFSGAETVVDLGGGSGTLLAATLEANPHLRGILLERAEMLPLARALLSQRGMTSRCEVLEGDFFKAVPEADVQILKLILHDWDDGRATAILCNCSRSLRPGGRVVIVDAVVPDDSSQPLLPLMDLTVLACLGGHERTQRELGELLSAAGLRINRILETGSWVQIVEAVHA